MSVKTARSRSVSSCSGSRLEPFVGEGGRHPQVEQHRVGWLLVNEPDQRQRIGGGAGHLDAAGGQRTGQALA
jgi:hypothetical protein